MANLSLSESDEIVNIEYVGEAHYYDFHVPETRNYWACGFFHHNSGKSILCEGLSLAKQWVLSVSSVTKFTSGYKSDKAGTEDHSLIEKLRNKTLVTKDGDTILKLPNREEVLAEARDLYDGVSRKHYAHGLYRQHERVDWTWILCGTSALREIDTSELGERFLDCVIVDFMPVDTEHEIGNRVINSTIAKMTANGDGAERGVDDLSTAQRKTAGYIHWLRTTADTLMKGRSMSEEAKEMCNKLGRFVAIMRARPSEKHKETVEREMSWRLIAQLTRLALCLSVVLNRDTVDEEVLDRVRQVAMDTARGRTFEIARYLYKEGREEGGSVNSISQAVNSTEDREGSMIRFLKSKGVGCLEAFSFKHASGGSTKRYRLTYEVHNLWDEMVEQRGEKYLKAKPPEIISQEAAEQAAIDELGILY